LSNDVSVIDTTSGRVTATIKLPDGPWGIAVAQ
jgi:YVTN family beta-propeller protein